jgi:hypothetical protein
MQAPPYTLTNESLTIVWEGKSHTVQRFSQNFKPLRQAILDEDWETVPKHLTITKSLKEWAQGKFTFEGDKFLFEGEEMPYELNQRAIGMASKGEDPKPLFLFWERVQKNPSWRSVKQLYPFLAHQGIPITEDGCFLAYKGVKHNFKDKHSGQFDNSPGQVHEMPRNQISDDPKEACHEGFHVGALGYAGSFADRVVVCKVDPADVVCVPYDSSQQKMRVCKYEVMGNHNGQHLPSTTFKEDEYPEPSHTPHGDAIRDLEDEEDDPDYDEESDPLVDEEDKEVEAKNYYLNEAHELPKEEKVLDISTAKRKPKKGFAKLDKMGMSELMEQSIDTLRQYAGKGLQIVGASKIHGGKTALVAKILEVRA